MLKQLGCQVAAVSKKSNPEKRVSIPALDGLRALACLLVLFSHAGNNNIFAHIPGTGQLGVMLFFALSGFLMAYLYGNSNNRPEKWLDYAIRRGFRVYPTYAAVIIIGFLIGLVKEPFVYAMSLEQLYSHLALEGTISIFWTIPVEMRYYILFPLISLFGGGLKLWKQALLYLVLAFAFIHFDLRGEKYALWPYVEFFILGGFSAYVYLLIERKTLAADILCMACFALIICSIPIISKNLFEWSHGLWGDAFFFGPLTALTVLSCAAAKGPFSKLLSSRPLRWIGLISFSLYLTHLPVIHFVRHFIPREYALIPSLVLSLACAWVFYRLFEKPSQTLGSTLSRLMRNQMTSFSDRFGSMESQKTSAYPTKQETTL